MRKTILTAVILPMISFMSAAGVQPLKVICASRADTPPKIDGRLDDPCWAGTEVREDFVPSSGEDAPMRRATAMRALYDDQNIYIGLQFFWDDIETLRKGVDGIVKKRGQSNGQRICKFENYANSYGVELFIDPGASEVNYYQILFNAAGQMTGHFKMRWDLFIGGPSFKSAVDGNCWTVEFVYPFKGLSPGGEWGVNVCRNDETYYSIWKPMTGAYNNPKMFGRLVIGSYKEWWDAVWGKGTLARLKEMGPGVDSCSSQAPHLKLLHGIVNKNAAKLSEFSKAHPLESREDFEPLYAEFKEFKSSFDRLESLYRTQRLISAAE